jgi:hypothetical protein
MVAVDGERHGALLHFVRIVTNFLLFGDQGDSLLLKIGIVVVIVENGVVPLLEDTDYSRTGLKRSFTYV